MNNVTYRDVMELVDAMVKIAVENEREACAKLCEKLIPDRGWLIEKALTEAATAIRARGIEN